MVVVYTEDALNGAGGQDGMDAQVAEMEAQANQILEDSLVNATVNVVFASLVDYAESHDSDTDLTRLRTQTDGYMDEVHDWRNAYGADVVTLLVEDFDYRGKAYLFLEGGNSSSGFNVVERQWATGVGFTFTHELGHNLGCGHDRVDGTVGYFPYSYGWAWEDGLAYRTVMAVSLPATRIPYFSNPDVLYEGNPTGIPEGDPEAADHAKTINFTASLVAAFRSPAPRISGRVTADAEGVGGTELLGLPMSAVTDADGWYRATVPWGWSGGVVPTRTGYVFNPTHRYYTTVIGNQTSQDYLATATGVRISGRVTRNGSGVPDVQMKGLPGDPMTDAEGAYSVVVGLGWSGTVTPTKENHVFDPIARDYTDVAGDQTNHDYTATRTYVLEVERGTGDGVYAEGEVVTIRANVYADKRFKVWTGDTANVADINAWETTVTMKADTLVRATHEDNTYTLTVHNGRGSGTYFYGRTVAIEATVPSGQRFVAWTGDTRYVTDENAAATEVFIARDTEVTATFQDITYALTVHNGTGSGTYRQDEEAAIEATVPTGKGFEKWTGDTTNVANVNAPETTVTMKSDTEVTATFEDLTYTLTVHNGTGSGTYTHGQAATIRATVPDDKQFKAWTGDTASVANLNAAETTVTVRADTEVTATFEPIRHTLTVLNGTGDGSYTSGTSVGIKATVPSGKKFKKWTGDTANVANVYAAQTRITIYDDTEVTATFESIRYTLTVHNGTGDGSYASGTSVKIKATVPTGKRFTKWTGYTANVANVYAAETKVTMKADTTVTATFEDSTCTLTVSVQGEGTVQPDGGTYRFGETVRLTAKPSRGWTFVQWGNDASGTSTSTQITMNRDMSVKAVFQESTSGPCCPAAPASLVSAWALCALGLLSRRRRRRNGRQSR